jgi:hypothetical protein
MIFFFFNYKVQIEGLPYWKDLWVDYVETSSPYEN